MVVNGDANVCRDNGEDGDDNHGGEGGLDSDECYKKIEGPVVIMVMLMKLITGMRRPMSIDRQWPPRT